MIRKKRKRYRDKKKQKIRQKKLTANGLLIKPTGVKINLCATDSTNVVQEVSLDDSSMTEADKNSKGNAEKDSDTKKTSSTTIEEKQEYINRPTTEIERQVLQYGWEIMEPDSDLTDTDHRWEEFEQQEERMRAGSAQKEIKLKEMYGEYVDMQPCIPVVANDQLQSIELPDYLTPVDRIFIKSKMVELYQKEEKIKEMARHYRDRCEQLQVETLKLKAEKLQLIADGSKEKAKVRHFWRNQILEAQSRSGKILHNALKIHESTIM